jgi:hypothetical protein
MMLHKMSWGLCSPEQQKQCIIISEVICKTVHKSADFVMVTYKIQLYFHAVSLPLTSVVILKKETLTVLLQGQQSVLAAYLGHTLPLQVRKWAHTTMHLNS